MAEILMWLIAAAILFLVFKMALILLLLAGLIFRTKETVGLIVLLGLLAIFNKYTGVCIAIGAIATVIALVRYGKKQRAASASARITDEAGD